jgi:hypothetical protein
MGRYYCHLITEHKSTIIKSDRVQLVTIRAIIPEENEYLELKNKAGNKWRKAREESNY